MQALVDQFLDYLTLERALSPNTREAYAQDLSAFTTFLAARKIATLNGVTRKIIMDFLMHEKDRGLASTSLSRRLVALRVFFRYLQQEGLLAANVTETMDSPKLWRNLPVTLTIKDVERMIQAPDTEKKRGLRDRAILETLYGAGLRASELTGLTLDDLHFDAGYIRCLGKGSKERLVPLGKSAAEAVKNYISIERANTKGAQETRCVFLSQRGKPLTRFGLFQLIKRYAQAAGLDHSVHPHTLRHSFATHLLSNQAPLRVIQEMLGHADIGTTQIYTHVDATRLKSVHAKFHPRA